ncbi:MAG: shikimate dehydrogenase [Cyanobacteria bacterium P01_H01_bin.74]
MNPVLREHQTAKPLKLGLLGSPLKHSLSPVLHHTALEQLSSIGQYLLHEVSREWLPLLIDQLEAEGYRGLNVTIPYKMDVMPFLDEISETARHAGAVNTIIFGKNNTRYGENTDVTGFLKSLPQSFLADAHKQSVMLIGAGGSARGVLLALLKAGGCGVQSVTIISRNIEKSKNLVRQLEQVAADPACKTRFISKELQKLTVDDFKNKTALFNSTPVGMWPDCSGIPISEACIAQLHPDALVYDLIYRPLQTQLLSVADKYCLTTMNGLDMLLYQGIASLEHWLGQPIPERAISASRQAMLTALNSE